jgi:glycosyltransferase involved in cell wall biosynthesis
MDTSLSVGIVTPRYAPAIGGVERHVEAIARSFAAMGISVEVITTDPTGHLPAEEIRDGVLVRRFRTFANDSVYFVSPALARWLLANSQRYDVLHAHSYHTPLAFQAALAGRRFGLPLVVTPHYHGGGHTWIRQMLHGPYRPIGGWMLHEASRIICVTEAEQTLLEADFGTLPTVVIPNAIDVTALTSAKPHPVPETQVTILAVGRMEAYKQMDRLIEAMPDLPAEYRAILIGAGQEYDSLCSRVEALGLRERVHMPGHVAQEELLAWYRTADVFVSMSQHEAFGLTVLEAAAAGAAVVASDIPAYREIARYVAPGRIHYLPTESNHQSLADAIKTAAALGRAQHVDKWPLPTWRSVSETILDCYQSVIGERSVTAHYSPI